MINGRFDRTIRPEQARSLFEAASEPKELRWYDGGHWPPQSAIDSVADWLAAKLDQLRGLDHSRQLCPRRSAIATTRARSLRRLADALRSA